MTAAIFRPVRPRSLAMARVFSAAATGLAAPMLVTMRIWRSRQGTRTARIRASSSGS
jgi:hypothetical protein